MIIFRSLYIKVMLPMLATTSCEDSHHLIRRFTSVAGHCKSDLEMIKEIWKCRTSKNETSWNSMKQTIVDLSVALRNTGKHYAKLYIRICTTAPKPDKQTKVGHIGIWQWTQCLYISAYAIVCLHPGSLHFPSLGPPLGPDTNEAEAGSSADTFPAGLEAAQHLKSWAMSCDQPRPRMALGIDKSQDLVT